MTRRASSRRRRSRTRSRPACRASSSTRAGRSSRIRACARRSAYAFDFEWTQQEPLLRRLHAHQELLLQLRARVDAALPGAEELKILEPFRGQGPGRGLHQGVPAAGDRRHAATSATARARRCGSCGEAGWAVKGQKLVDAPTGEPFAFEILLDDPHVGADRAALREEPRAPRRHRARAHRRRRAVREAAGRLRLRHDRRASGAQSLSPGNEQRDFWGSAGRRRRTGSRNLAGIKDPVVDELIDLVIAGARPARAWSPAPARSTACCCGATTSSRTGTSGRSASPTGTSSAGRPSSPKYALGFDTWWVDAAEGGRARPAQGRDSEVACGARRCSPTSSAASC